MKQSPSVAPMRITLNLKYVLCLDMTIVALIAIYFRLMSHPFNFTIVTATVIILI